jgi:hypothetical protein
MKITTADSSIFIIEQEENRVVYETTTGEQWEITGQCSACGECEVGAVDTYYEEVEGEKMPVKKHYQIWTEIPVGQPGACLDVRYGNRLDIPIRPELPSKLLNCTLSGRYL